jgi:hypothetical protein
MPGAFHAVMPDISSLALPFQTEFPLTPGLGTCEFKMRGRIGRRLQLDFDLVLEISTGAAKHSPDSIG